MHAARGITLLLASSLDRGKAFHVRRIASGPSGSAAPESAVGSVAMAGFERRR